MKFERNSFSYCVLRIAYRVSRTAFNARRITHYARLNNPQAPGISLLEILIAVILVGLAITALLASNRSFTMANGAGADLSTADFLVEQIRELTAMLPYDDLDNFVGTDGVENFCPPIAADKTVLNDFGAFTQNVAIENLNPANFEQVAGYDSNFLRVTVKVFLNAKEISSTSWIRARY